MPEQETKKCIRDITVIFVGVLAALLVVRQLD